MFLSIVYISDISYGYNYNFVRYEDLYNYIKTTPKESIFLGYPDPVIDGIQLFGERAIFVGYETYTPFHKKYYENQRERMNTMLKIIFSDNKEDLEKLIRENKITHLILPKDFFKNIPELFEPFSSKVRQIIKIKENFYLSQLKPDVEICNYKIYVLKYSF